MALSALNLNNLSPEETADPAKVPLADWQRRELDRRLDEVDREGPTGIPWDRVLSEIEGRTR